MPLFPQLGPQYYDEKDRNILERMESFYSSSITLNQSFWGEADIDTRFEAGDQTVLNDLYGNLPAQRRRQFTFNRIRRVINMIGGYQRRNRMSTIAVPVENADQDTADQFTKLFMHINNSQNVYETISDSFHGALVTGMNLLQVWVDFREDPVNGCIKIDNCSYNSFLIDPYFRKHDLSDCMGLWKRSFVTMSEAISLMPDSKEEIMGLSVESNNRDGKFQFMPESYNYGYTNFLTYDEYYYKDYRTQKLLVDSQTGETMEWTSDNNDGLKMFLQQFPTVTVTEHEVPTVKLAIVIQGKVMYDGPNPLGIDQYPFVPVLGYYTPQMPYFPWRIQGVVRGLRDAQFLYNRRRIIELDILESQINSGWKMKENALVNPKDAFETGQGRVLAVKTESAMTDVEQIQAPNVPPSMLQLSELLGKEIQEISGVNEELLGSAIDDKAGILAMLRQGAGLTTLQKLFDQLDYSQKLLGNIVLRVIQTNFTPGKIKRIIEQEPTEQFYNKNFGRYDVSIQEGFNTPTQRQLEFAQLTQLKSIGVPIPDEAIINAATIQNKTKILEQIQMQQQQAMQIQQQQAQGQAELQQAQAQLARARAAADEGLGVERLSRVEENRALAVERSAEAQKDRELGLLHLAKAMKEIEGLDIEHIEKLMNLASMIKEYEKATQEEVPQGLGALAGLGGQETEMPTPESMGG